MKKHHLVCLFLAIIVSVFADMTWTESFSDYENSLSTYQDSIFYRFSYLGAGGTIYKIGTPELPVKITNLIIRRDEQVDSITIDFIDTTHYGYYLIYPCQDTTDTFDVPDTSIYNSSNIFPDSIVKLAGTTFFDGANKIVQIETYPLCYKGSDTLVIINEEIDYTIHTSSTTDTGNIASIRATIGARDLDRSLQTLVSNDDSITLFSYSPPLDTLDIAYDYLIITQDSLEDYWCRFAEWKRDLGYKVRIRTVSWITTYYSGTDTTDKIKNYLTTAYLDSGAVYVLLGGDYANIPGFLYGSSGIQDISYSELFSLGSFDIQVMRIPARNGTEITNWCNKLINYEKFPGYCDSLEYLDNTLYAAAQEWRSETTIWSRFTLPMNEIADLTNLIYENSTRIEEDTVRSCYHFSYGEDIIDSVNNALICNKHMIGFYGHGFPERIDINNHHYTSDSLWECRSEIYSDPSVDIGGHDNGFLSNLSNQGYPSIMLNSTCGTAMLSPHNYPFVVGWSGPTLSESFLFSENKGGIVYSGNITTGIGSSAFNFVKGFLIGAQEYEKIGHCYYYSLRSDLIGRKMGMFGEPTMEMWQNFPLERFLYTFDNSDSIIVTRYSSGGTIAMEGVVVSLIDSIGNRYSAITDASGVAEFGDAAINFDARRFARITISGHECPWLHEMTYDFIPLVIHGSHSDDYWQPCCEPDSGFYMSGDNALTMDFVIPEDVSLNIEKGSNIWVEPDALHDSTSVINKIEVISKGELTSIGSEGINIEFDIKPDPWHTNEPGDWYGIVIDSLGKAEIRHTDIKYSYRGIDINSKYADTVIINNCHISNSEIAGIRTKQDSIVFIDSCLIDSCRNYGIHTEGPNLIYFLEINDCQIESEGNSGSGIYGQEAYKGLSLNRITTVGFQEGFNIMGGYGSINRCNVKDFNRTGILFYGTETEVDSCVIEKSAKGIGIFYYGDGDEMIFRNNVFDSLDGGLWTNHSGIDVGDSAVADSGQNSFREIYTFALRNNGKSSVKAEYNYWGDDDSSTIASLIVGAVDWIPFLSSDPNTGWAKRYIEESAIPREFELLGNFPNPFNASTIIKVKLPESAFLDLKIYNLSGREVSDISSNGIIGVNNIVWDGTSSDGKSLPSGVYYYKLNAIGISGEEYNAKNKMVIIK